MSLSGRTALITESTFGLGRAIAHKLAKEGANVVVTGSRWAEGSIFSVAEEIRREQGKVVPLVLDVGDIEDVKKAVGETKREFGALDILVNNCPFFGRAFSTHMFRTNLLGPIYCIKESLGHLAQSHFGGHVVNLSPPLDCNPAWGNSAYSTSALGHSLVTLGLSQLLEEDSVSLNSLWSRTVLPHPLLAHALTLVLHSRRSGHFFLAEDLLGDDLPGEDQQVNSTPSLFVGDPQHVLLRRTALARTALLDDLFARINLSLGEPVGHFSIELEDCTWTVGGGSPHFYRDHSGGAPCRLVMTALTLRDILDKKISRGMARTTNQIRIVGDRDTALGALSLLFDFL